MRVLLAARLSLAGAAFALLAACSGMETGPDEAENPTRAYLGIAPIAQQTPVWCWAATSEMVFRYHGMPNVNPAGNYQCGIVASYGVMVAGPSSSCNLNCFSCVQPIGPMYNLEVLVDNYDEVAIGQFGRPSPPLSGTLLTSPLTLAGLAGQLDGNRPVLGGVSFNSVPLPGISEHFVVLVGYDALGSTPTVTVNDPFPYAYAGISPDPWSRVGGVPTMPGQYEVPYDELLQVWHNTIVID